MLNMAKRQSKVVKTGRSRLIIVTLSKTKYKRPLALHAWIVEHFPGFRTTTMKLNKNVVPGKSRRKCPDGATGNFHWSLGISQMRWEIDRTARWPFLSTTTISTRKPISLGLAIRHWRFFFATYNLGHISLPPCPFHQCWFQLPTVFWVKVNIERSLGS